MADFKRFGGFRSQGGGHFDRKGDGRRPFGDRPPFKKFGPKRFGDDRRGGFRGDDRGERELFSATCAECGNTCEVPFRPTGEKPVFCKDCFAAKKGDAPRGDRREQSRDARSEGRPQHMHTDGLEEVKAHLASLHAKVDALMALLTPATTAEAAEPALAAETPAPAEKKSKAKKEAQPKAATTKRVEAAIAKRRAAKKK